MCMDETLLRLQLMASIFSFIISRMPINGFHEKCTVLYSPPQALSTTSTSPIFATSIAMKVKPTLFEPPWSPLFNGRGIEAF